MPHLSFSGRGRKLFLKEKLQINTGRIEEGCRSVDFRITLEALVEGVRIGGSDDEKGYGGFSARIRTPDDLKFISGNGPVVPQNLQIRAGDRMQFSGSLYNMSLNQGSEPVRW